MVTMYHWDLPQYLQDLGGWTNPRIVNYFKVYADLLYKSYGDRVKDWITFNEPWIHCKFSYAFGFHPPQIRQNQDADYLCAHNILLAHSAAYHLYQDKYAKNQQASIGICLDFRYSYPLNKNVTDEIIDKAIQFKFGWLAHPIFSDDGDYPAVMREKINAKSADEGRRMSRLPKFTAGEIAKLKGSADFLALNYYTSSLVVPYKDYPGYEQFSSDDDILQLKDPKWKRSSFIYLVPEGLYDALNWIKEHYNNPRVMITENGWSDNGSMEDDDRINYLKQHLEAASRAVHNGCNLEAYMVWSMIDNFEWASGYKKKNSELFTSISKVRTKHEL